MQSRVSCQNCDIEAEHVSKSATTVEAQDGTSIRKSAWLAQMTVMMCYMFRHVFYAQIKLKEHAK